MKSDNRNGRDHILDVDHLSMHFTTKKRGKTSVVKAVDDVSFYVERGETFGLVGESGCGKTTTGRTIIRLYDPTSGTVSFDGKEISGKMDKSLRKYITDNIAMIFQDPIASLNPRMTVQEIIAEGLKIRGVKDPEELHRQVVAMLEHVGLQAEHASRYPHEFSGGQRQRVMIAMALVCKPEILIADEPTTALDVTIQAQILDLMNQLKKETGTSILFITHDLGVVAEVCDDVAVMYCGRVVERGDVKTIFANSSHPYTKGLLGSIPRLGDAGKELKSIPGNVPNPKYMPKGCKFEPRCPYASEKCREEEPGFFQIEEGHISRCWLCESGQLKTDHVEKAGD